MLIRWESDGSTSQNDTTISHNVTNFEFLYEPFYVSTDTVPPHDERFLGYGFTRNTQVTIDSILDCFNLKMTTITLSSFNFGRYTKCLLLVTNSKC